ncbi:MAG: YidB family protein [Gammaproteobacteria bacterium]|nr:YidB family protein [Gammaproteobacteria bacterium]
MDFMDIATKMLGDKLGGGGGDADALKGVLGKLIGGGDSLDLAGLVGGLKDKGLGDIADSWLGDGENADISADQVKDLIGDDKLKQAAEALGTEEDSLLDGLKDLLPQMVDKSSSGGSLLDSLGGLGGIAKKFL